MGQSLLSKRLALMIFGAILVISGLIWGCTSHQVNYQSYSQSANYQIVQGTRSGNIYIHANGSSEYFVAINGDFTPAISDNTLNNWAEVSFVAHTDYNALDPKLTTDNGQTIDQAHRIAKLIFYDQSGSVLASYTTTAYNDNPNGVDENNWPGAILFMVVGAATVVLTLVFGKKARANTGFSISTPVSSYGQPYQQPNPYGQPDPYEQAYQNPQQYPPATPYPPQETVPVYGQPVYNPYQQPQE